MLDLKLPGDKTYEEAVRTFGYPRNQLKSWQGPKIVERLQWFIEGIISRNCEPWKTEEDEIDALANRIEELSLLVEELENENWKND